MSRELSLLFLVHFDVPILHLSLPIYTALGFWGKNQIHI